MVVAVCVGLVFASPAAATTVTIGAPDVSGHQATVGGMDATFAQVAQPTPGVLLTAPADGVITAWHVHANASGDGSVALRVLRRHADGTFTAVATSDPVTASAADGSPAHAVSMPVLAGDYIGVDVAATSVPSSPAVFTTQPSGASYGEWAPRLADGSTLAPSNAGADSGRLMLNAVETLRPAVSGVSPASGPTSGGQAVTISGSNLDGATGVSFGGTPAGSFTASAKQIRAVAPARAAGTIDVQVTGPGGVSSATGADAYTYATPPAPSSSPPDAAAPPTIASIPPAAGTPIVSGAGETAKMWRESDALAHVSANKKLPVGTTFSFGLNEAATVTLSFTRRAAGHKAHRRCVAPTAKNRHKPRCTRTIVAGTLALAGHPGANKVRFAGRISRTNKLKPGRYTLRITATDTQGKRSATRSLTFTIVK